MIHNFISPTHTNAGSSHLYSPRQCRGTKLSYSLQPSNYHMLRSSRPPTVAPHQLLTLTAQAVGRLLSMCLCGKERLGIAMNILLLHVVHLSHTAKEGVQSLFVAVYMALISLWSSQLLPENPLPTFVHRPPTGFSSQLSLLLSLLQHSRHKPT